MLQEVIDSVQLDEDLALELRIADLNEDVGYLVCEQPAGQSYDIVEYFIQMPPDLAKDAFRDFAEGYSPAEEEQDSSFVEDIQ